MASFEPTHELPVSVEARPIVSVSANAVMVELPNGDTRLVAMPPSFGGRPPAVGDMLIRFWGVLLSYCPADVFFRDARPLDASLVEAARSPVRMPVVEEPRVPRYPLGGRPHP